MTSGQIPELEPLTPAWWTREILHVREALRALGEQMQPCLPGEEQDCGDPLPAHYAGELALLIAKAQILIETNTPELVREAQHVVQAEYVKLREELASGTHLDPRR